MGTFNTASFPVGNSVDAADPAYSSYQTQLGHEIERANGVKYRLVQATNADTTTGRKLVYKFTSYSAFTVEKCGDAEVPCGVQKSDQVSLGAGDLFWLQIAGVATCVDSGASVTADDIVDTGAAGEVTTNNAVSALLETVVGTVLANADADADVYVRLRGGL